MTLNELRNQLLKQARFWVYHDRAATPEGITIPGTKGLVSYNPFTAVCIVYDTTKHPMPVLFRGSCENAANFIAENVFLLN